MTSFGGNVNRREFVASGVAGAAGAYALTNPLLSGAAPVKLPTAGSNRLAYSPSIHFPSGVACGEVTQREITLWTQMEPRATGTWLYAEVASDKGFSNIVRRGKTWVAKESVAASTARLRVTDSASRPKDYPDTDPWARLEAGKRYWYRFYHLKRVRINGKWVLVEDFSSPPGRFRTSYDPPAKPGDPVPDIKIAFFACQDFGTGFYNAHQDMAAQDVDLVVGLGDYIYEQAYFVGDVRQLPKTPDGQVRTLPEYRNQYRAYTADQYLQAVRAMAPMTIIWDDHEVADNYAGTHPGGYELKGESDNQPPRDKDLPTFLERRANGYRAFFEAQPLMPRTDNIIYGKQTTGNVDLFRLDTRQYRTDQPCNPEDAFIHFCDSQTDTLDPNATQMGAAQRQWFVDGMQSSKADWKIVANQVMMMSLDVVFPGLVANTDSWDGYSAERAYICDQIKKIKGVSFITGDIHTFFAGSVTRTGRRGDIPYGGMEQGPNVATELVVGSITSQGISDRVASLWFGSDLGKWANQGNPGDQEGLANAVAGLVDPSITNWNPHMCYANSAYKGYGLMTISGDTMKMKFRATHNPKVQGSAPFTLASFTVNRDENVVHRDAVASDRRNALPVAKGVKFTKHDAPGAVMDFLGSH